MFQELLQNEGIGGQALGNLVGVFSELAVITSLIGFIYGLIDGLTDLSNLPTKGPEFDKWKLKMTIMKREIFCSKMIENVSPKNCHFQKPILAQNFEGGLGSEF